MVSEGRRSKSKKSKRKRELAKQELQLKRKRTRSDKLQQRQGALFEDAGEERVVVKKKSKSNQKGLESDPEGTRGERGSNDNEHNLALNSSRNGQFLNPKSSIDEHVMNPECRETGHSISRQEAQDLEPERISDGHSKRLKREQKLNSQRSIKGQQSNSECNGKKHILNSGCSIHGQELPATKDNNEETLKASMEVKEKKKKKNKKKRDRWGQVLNDAGNTQDTANCDNDATVVDNVSTLEDAAHEDGNEVLAERDGHKGEYDNKTVCAGGMPYDTTEEDILSFFKECGTITRVVCMTFADTQRFKGLAFISFETETAASKALSLDGTNMGGRHIKVEKARAGGKVFRAPPKREPGSLSVYIGNLDWGVQKIDLKRFFKGCDIDDVRLAVHKNTGDFRGYGHVDFSDEKSLEKAIKMNQKQLLGRPVKVSYAVPKGKSG